MVPTLPARGSFYIVARHKGFGGSFSFVLPVRALAGRTFEALGNLPYVKEIEGFVNQIM
jgi:hypothetical protein